MDIANSKNLSINQNDLNVNQIKIPQSDQKENDVKFSDELKNVKPSDEAADAAKEVTEAESDVKDAEVKQENVKKTDVKQEELPKEENKPEQVQKNVKSNNEQVVQNADKHENLYNINEAINGLSSVFDEIGMLNQKDEMLPQNVKSDEIPDDNNKYKQKETRQEDSSLIDNNMNIQEPQDKLGMQQMASNMEFNSDGKPFSQFVKQSETKDILPSTTKDIAEEKQILSTMEENIAIANKNMAMSKTKTVENEHGVQKFDKKTNIVVDTIVSYDNVIMDKADVEFFTNLVENGVVDIKDVQAAEKSSRVSKTLADLLVKAMNDNRPIRIDFDNDISVIIKIDRAGKISADFLPSSQVAEAYLKENLPLLRQRFDDNNIDYNELNQRQRKQENQNNRKKERKDE